VILADRSTFTASVAERLVNLRNRDADDLFTGLRTVQKEMRVRFFDVAIQQPHLRAEHACEVHETVVFPVPPLPDATAIVMQSLHASAAALA